MLSVSRRGVVVSVLANAVLAVIGAPLAACDDAKRAEPVSPETILENRFEGKATVELRVAEVHTLNIDSLYVPDVSHAQFIYAKITGANSGQKFVVAVSREVATRLLMLGIEDPAAHFRGKVLRVSGIVERIKSSSGPSRTVFIRIRVTKLHQLERIRKP